MNIYLPYDPDILPRGIYPRERKIRLQESLYRSVYSNCIHPSHRLEITWVPIAAHAPMQWGHAQYSLMGLRNTVLHAGGQTPQRARETRVWGNLVTVLEISYGGLWVTSRGWGQGAGVEF